MKENEKKTLFLGSVFTIAFIVWTWLIQTVDVQPVGKNGTDIGFATLNLWFHKLTDVNMLLYTITDWMGLVPLFVCIIFAGIGFCQLVRRKSFFKVDVDIIVLGVYYVVVMGCYLVFEAIPINYRPILIDGVADIDRTDASKNEEECFEQSGRGMFCYVFIIYGSRKIYFRSSLVYGYCWFCVFKYRTISYLQRIRTDFP